jgi:glycosyltransferase involved in cell wall biosynthesis
MKTCKNSEELLATLPIILRETPTTEFVVVGNGALAGEMEKLQGAWHGRLRYIRELERRDAWELIASSFYAYTPVKHGGWGFIGDAWAARTPLIATHDGYEFKRGVDALVAEPTRVGQAIRELYDHEDLYVGLQTGGRFRYEQYHTAERVAQEFYQVFKDCL